MVGEECEVYCEYGRRRVARGKGEVKTLVVVSSVTRMVTSGGDI